MWRLRFAGILTAAALAAGFGGCRTAEKPVPPAGPEADMPARPREAVAPPGYVPPAPRTVAATRPATPPLWHTDYDAWLNEDLARSRRVFRIGTGEAATETLARRYAEQDAVAALGLTTSQRQDLRLTASPYVIEYSDGSCKVFALYEYLGARNRPVEDGPKPWRQAVDELSEELLRQAAQHKDVKIASLGVSGFGYKETPFPCEFSDFIEAELCRAIQQRVGGRMKVVHPSLLKSEGGLGHPDAAVGGTYWPGAQDRTVRVQATMVDMGSGNLLATASADMAIDAKVRVEPLNTAKAEQNLSVVEDLRKKVRAESGGKNFRISLWLPDGRRAWRKGERLVFHVRSERDCYLNLLHFDSTGGAQLLFPNQWHQDALIQAGKTYKIPGPEMNFDFEVSDPFGTDIVMAIGTAVRTNDLYAFRQGQDQGFRSFEGGTRGIAVNPRHELAGLPPDQKAEAVLTFTTMP